MKNILFFLLIPVFSFAQKVEKDSMLIRNDSVFYVRTQQLYEYVPDTVGLRDRYVQLQGIIATFETAYTAAEVNAESTTETSYTGGFNQAVQQLEKLRLEALNPTSTFTITL